MVKIVLTGLNGYGGHFVEPLLRGDGSYKLIAVVSRNPKKSQYYEYLRVNQVRFYDCLENCLLSERADIVIITTPMHVHFKEVMCALKRGISVYCEKPLASDSEQCRQIAEMAKRKGCQAAVGYQWSHSKAVTDLKKDLLDGRYGKLQKIKAMAVWNRPKSYYGESDWKGRYFGKDGESIQESVISNGTSHFLHNLLFLSGNELKKAAVPVHIYGEAYRAHAIETFDTACIRMETESGCELFYMATLSAKENHAPEFMAECEKAIISYPSGTEKGNSSAIKIEPIKNNRKKCRNFSASLQRLFHNKFHFYIQFGITAWPWNPMCITFLLFPFFLRFFKKLSTISYRHRMLSTVILTVWYTAEIRFFFAFLIKSDYRKLKGGVHRWAAIMKKACTTSLWKSWHVLMPWNKISILKRSNIKMMLTV